MSTNVRSRGWYLGLGIAIISSALGSAVSLTLVSTNCAIAQITPDATLPNNSTVKLEGNTRIIEGGTKADGNLFHSFREFSVPTGSEAHFNNVTDIENIISRVTGGSISNIDGLIRTSGTANLFLINPSGIVFGPNASLNVGGSFLASTASTVKFADGFEFSVNTPQTTPLLTVNVPIGLQYGGNSGSIGLASQVTNSRGETVGLQVQPGKTLAIVGKDVILDGGRLTAPGGRVELGGVSGAGTVGLNGNNLNLNFSDGVARSDVSLINGAEINVIAGNGGSIAVNARNIDVLGESRLLGGIGSGLGLSDSQAGDITLNATGTIRAGQGSRIQSIVEANGTGNAGNLNITTDSLIITDGTKLVTSVFGQGNAGNVTIRATDISFDGVDRNGFLSGVFTSLEQGAAGRAGNIDLTAESLSANNGAQISATTFGQGNAGNITIDADSIFLNGVSNNGFSSGVYSSVVGNAVGQAGNISVTAESLSVNNGAQISAITFGQGNAGNITIDANTISLNGVSRNGFSSGVNSSVEGNAVGQAGNISVTTESLSITNGAILNSSTFGIGNSGNITIDAREAISLAGVGSNGFLSGIFNNVSLGAVGEGGNISLTTKSLSASNGAQIIASTFGQGNAGSITIDARDSISLRGVSSNGFSPSGVFSGVEDRQAVGNGGNISITTGSLSVTDGARLSASTFGRGNTGNINIQAKGDIVLNGVGGRFLSGVFNQVSSGVVGNTGNIDITAESLSASKGAQISATTFGQGNAGNVTINANTISLNGVSSNGFSSGVYSSVEDNAVGNGGNISVTTGLLSLTDGAQINTNTSSQGNTGNVNIQANTISLEGIGSNGNLSGVFSGLGTRAIGEGGNISLTTKSLSASNGAQISATTYGQGNAGSITIDARDSISLRGVSSNGFSPSGVFSGVEDRQAVGNGGNISITTGSLSVTDGARLSASTFGRGDTGNIIVQARDNILLNGVGGNEFRSGVFNDVLSGAIGNAGNISLTTKSLSATNGARISSNTSGLGNAGNVTIDSIDTVSFDGNDTGVFSDVRNRGNGGNVTITTGTLSVKNQAQLSASTFFLGNAGNINIDARNGVSVDGINTGVFSQVGPIAEGGAGKVTITTRTLSVTDGATIAAATLGRGNAGDVAINARDVYLDGANSVVASAVTRVRDWIGEGKGGNVTITTGSLSVTNGARLIASTNAKGDAGSVTINADNMVSFDGVGSDGITSQAITAVLSGGQGNAGNITINTGSLSVTNGAQLITISEEQGEAGSVIINARDNVSFNGHYSSVVSRSAVMVGKAGDITITTGSFSATDGAFLNASTYGKGNAGSIKIDARDTVLATNGANVTSIVGEGAEGNAGGITITTGSFSATDGAFLSASTYGKGNAGSIKIDARDTVLATDRALLTSIVGEGAEGNAGGITISTGSFSVTNGAILTTTTAGQGNAGSIKIDASDRIFLAGNDTGIFSRIRPEAVGTAGNITITTGSLFITDEAQLTTSNIGQGQAGEIAVTARSVSLDKKGAIQATTVSGNGGNINLNVQDLLLLRRGSQISTTAGTEQAGGDGGNITINSPFIVAVPKENSDISANAFTGTGGRVDITANSIFGIQSRPRPTSLSDITASSERGVAGTVEINTPDVDPNRGLVELPTNLVDASQQIDQSCTPGSRQTASSFIVTGRGGLPLSPTEPLQDSATLAQWVRPRAKPENPPKAQVEKQATQVSTTPQVSPDAPIVEANGWVIDGNGDIVLVATAPNVSSHSQGQTPTSCTLAQ